MPSPMRWSCTQGNGVILKQVNNGIAVRMAVMAMAMAGQRQAGDFKPYN
ncbi:Aspartate carbamoyltransferase [Moraxella catarrhalis]|nr:Aspartate carbamoyltransferase [Moraxella catarrhalis]